MKQLPIYRVLTAQPSIVAILADRIFEDVAPEGTSTPYLVWSDLSGVPNTSLDNITNEDQVAYQVMIYSPNQKTASDIRTVVAEILQEHSFIDQRFGNYETDTRLFARGFSGNWWVSRTKSNNAVVIVNTSLGLNEIQVEQVQDIISASVIGAFGEVIERGN